MITLSQLEFAVLKKYDATVFKFVNAVEIGEDDVKLTFMSNERLGEFINYVNDMIAYYGVANPQARLTGDIEMMQGMQDRLVLIFRDKGVPTLVEMVITFADYQLLLALDEQIMDDVSNVQLRENGVSLRFDTSTIANTFRDDLYDLAISEGMDEKQDYLTPIGARLELMADELYLILEETFR